MKYTIEYIVSGKTRTRTASAEDTEDALEKHAKWYRHNVGEITMQDTFRVLDEDESIDSEYE